MPTDDERRSIAAALRAYDGKGADADTIGEIMAIIIGAGDFEGWSWREVFARLADLIEPSEPKVKCVAEVKVDGGQLEKLAHDAAVELTGIDRDALLALASGLEADADRIIIAAKNARFGGGPRMGEAKHAAYEWRSIARRIREACGEAANG